MKTAISVPDEIFRRVDEKAAVLKMNRSEFYTRAAEHYLTELDSTLLTEAINAAVDRGDRVTPHNGVAVARGAESAADSAAAGLTRLGELTEADSW